MISCSSPGYAKKRVQLSDNGPKDYPSNALRAASVYT